MPPHLLVRDWRAVTSPDHPYLSMVDGAGVERARLLGLGPLRRDLPGRGSVVVQLPDGTHTTLRNGTTVWGPRRWRTRGTLPLHGVSYVFEHRTWSRARVLRDGAWIATVRSRVRGPQVDLRAVLTPDDELACAVFAHVLRAGRTTVLGKVAEVFSGGV